MQMDSYQLQLWLRKNAVWNSNRTVAKTNVFSLPEALLAPAESSEKSTAEQQFCPQQDESILKLPLQYDTLSGDSSMIIAPSTRGLTCVTCGLAFDTLQDQQNHFRRDALHRMNLRRKLEGLPPLSSMPLSSAVEEGLIRMDLSESASIYSGSTRSMSRKGRGNLADTLAGKRGAVRANDGVDSDSDSSVDSLSETETATEKASSKGLSMEDEEEEDFRAKQISFVSEQGTVNWKFTKSTGPIYIFRPQRYPELEYSISTVQLGSGGLKSARGVDRVDPWTEFSLAARHFRSNPIWTVLILRSGKFSGAVFEGMKLVLHKVFRRYTVRAKAGGGQSSHDNKSGKARSAGAMLRRYGEQALKEDIQRLLAGVSGAPAGAGAEEEEEEEDGDSGVGGKKKSSKGKNNNKKLGNDKNSANDAQLWPAYVQSSSVILISAPKTMRSILFTDPSSSAVSVSSAVPPAASVTMNAAKEHVLLTDKEVRQKQFLEAVEGAPVQQQAESIQHMQQPRQTSKQPSQLSSSSEYILTKDDPRIRYVPFVVDKPTLESARAVHAKCSSVTFRKVEVEAIVPVGAESPLPTTTSMDPNSASRADSVSNPSVDGHSGGTNFEMLRREIGASVGADDESDLDEEFYPYMLSCPASKMLINACLSEDEKVALLALRDFEAYFRGSMPAAMQGQTQQYPSLPPLPPPSPLEAADPIDADQPENSPQAVSFDDYIGSPLERDFTGRANRSQQPAVMLLPPIIPLSRGVSLEEWDMSTSISMPDSLDEMRTALHIASSLGMARMVHALLEKGANPGKEDVRGRTPFFLAKDKDTRDAFRRYRATHEEQWEWDSAGVPIALTEEMEKNQKQKEKEKKKRAAQRKKESKLKEEQDAEDARQALEEQKKAQKAAILQRKEDAGKCAGCEKSLYGIAALDVFSRRCCSSTCVVKLRRQLAADAALKRFGGSN